MSTPTPGGRSLFPNSAGRAAAGGRGRGRPCDHQHPRPRTALGYLRLPSHPSRRRLLGLLGAAGAGAALSTGLSGTALAATATAAAAPSPAGGLRWPQGQALPSFAAPAALDVVDLTTASTADQLLFATLQGVVNRARPRIALLRPADEGETTWLDGIGVPSRTVGDPRSLLAKYRAEIRGLIVTDPAQPATVNLATTLAGCATRWRSRRNSSRH